MTDKINLNTHISSLSITSYRDSLKGLDSNSNEVRNGSANINYESDDEEYTLIDNKESIPVNQEIQSDLKNCASNLLKALEVDMELYFIKELVPLADWNDAGVAQLQNNFASAKEKLNNLIEKYETEFLQQYSGDGTNIEADFMEFLESKSDYRTLTEKYNQSFEYENLEDYQKKYDDISTKLYEQKNSSENFAEIQYLEVQQNNLKTIINLLKSGLGYRQAALGG